MDVGEEMIQIENGITHNLSRAMVGYIAAAVDGIEASINTCQRLFIQKQIGHIAALAQGVYVGMFNKKQVVSCDHLFFYCFRSISEFYLHSFVEVHLLQIPACFVIHTS